MEDRALLSAFRVSQSSIQFDDAVKLTRLKKPIGSVGENARPPRLKDLIGTSLGSTLRIVFAALCEYANPRTEMWPVGALKLDGFAAWPSVQTLAAMTGLSVRAVQAALRDLEAAGAIRCIYRSPGGGSVSGDRTKRQSTCCYLITPQHVHPMYLVKELKQQQRLFRPAH